MKDIIEVQGRLFKVKRKFKESQINLVKGNASTLKKLYQCDTVFKSQGLIWVCDEIKEVEYEEIKKTPIEKLEVEEKTES
tara:strand:- start:328 stop:567 length:240 start_codon:yes stop_codon:yes gene_type:complete